MWINLRDSELALIRQRVDGTPLAKKITTWIADQSDPRHGPYHAAAQEQASDELEVDDDAIVSPGGDPGAWVMTWTWISDEQAGVNAEDDETVTEEV